MFCARFLFYGLLLASLTACVPAGQSQQQKKDQQAEVHYKLGISHLQGNNPTMALRELLVAVENGPQNSSIHASLAQAYQSKKAYPQAEEHYLKAIALSDNDPRYQNNLASLYLDMEQWDDAINYFGKAASNLLFLNSHVALSGKGFALYKKGDYPAALEQLEEVVVLAPGYAPAYFLQSETYLAMGNDKSARRALEKAIDIAPDFTQAHYQLAVLLMKDQQTEAAISHFLKVVEISPGSELGLKAAEMLRALKKSATDEG